MASKALSLSGLFQDPNTISIGGATISSDPATGAVAIVPAVTDSVANPTAVVFSRGGGITTVETSGGVVAAASIATAEAAAPPVFDSSVVINLIDSDYINARVTASGGGGGTGIAIAMSIVFGG